MRIALTDTGIVVSLIVWLMSLASVRDAHTWQTGNMFAPLVAPMAGWLVTAGLFAMPLVFIALIVFRIQKAFQK